MKRNCLQVGSLLFLLLALLTILAHRVEVWMLPQVETASIQVEESTGVSYLPLDALGADGSGQGLYQVVQQGGWSEGAVALPVDPGEYTVFPDRVVLEICQGPYIRYASKGFRDGDLVEVLSSSREREDEYWLAVFPSGTLSLEEADRTLVVEAQSAGCALFLAQGAQQPFMPGRALGKLFPAQKTPVDCRFTALRRWRIFLLACPICALPPAWRLGRSCCGSGPGNCGGGRWPGTLLGQQPCWWLFFSCCRGWHFHPPCCPGAMSLIFPTTPRSFPRSSPLLRSPL